MLFGVTLFHWQSSKTFLESSGPGDGKEIVYRLVLTWSKEFGIYKFNN